MTEYLALEEPPRSMPQRKRVTQKELAEIAEVDEHTLKHLVRELRAMLEADASGGRLNHAGGNGEP